MYAAWIAFLLLAVLVGIAGVFYLHLGRGRKRDAKDSDTSNQSVQEYHQRITKNSGRYIVAGVILIITAVIVFARVLLAIATHYSVI